MYRAPVEKDGLLRLVAGDGFRLFAGSRSWRDVDWLIRVGEVGWRSLLDVCQRANLHHRRLRLFQNQLFIDSANFGLFFISLFAPRAIFFRRGERHIVFEVTYASSVIGVNH